ncbi:MAG: class I SAM-dependent methyltransferase [Ancalomicrobiaceae bacterium]|nr:class I SAM-dependent methyltransferase [Ancalomicrobiaceae bacterium]
MKLYGYRTRTFVKKLINDLWTIYDYGRYHPIRGLREQSYRETIDYIMERLPGVMAFSTERGLMDYTLGKVSVDGHMLEFGVYTGGSINYIAKKVAGLVHGFDSFEGLPDDWDGFDRPKNSFSLSKRVPSVRKNVVLHAGWFDATLPKWAAENPGPVSFIHVDCDIYSSTKCVFDILSDRIVPGTIILFDEYFNVPGWKLHEFKAFQEYISQRGVHYDYIGYSVKEVAIKII